jgi:membrane protein implicated in regulation of membrane protease activity
MRSGWWVLSIIFALVVGSFILGGCISQEQQQKLQEAQKKAQACVDKAGEVVAAAKEGKISPEEAAKQVAALLQQAADLKRVAQEILASGAPWYDLIAPAAQVVLGGLVSGGVVAASSPWVVGVSVLLNILMALSVRRSSTAIESSTKSSREEPKGVRAAIQDGTWSGLLGKFIGPLWAILCYRSKKVINLPTPEETGAKVINFPTVGETGAK